MRKISLLLAMSALVACGKSEKEVVTVEKKSEPEIREVQVKVTENTWGIPFVSTPIQKASKEIQEAGKAVAHIFFAEGGTATGFFVSSDGLFLTNEHVISRKTCSKTHCNGIKIIRDFHENGEMEIFHRFKVVAHHSKLDYALLKVDLGEKKSVPYIKLKDPKIKLELKENHDDFQIIGHPFGSSLRTSQAVIHSSRDPNKLKLKSVAISGNSGSPLFDPNDGTAIGLYFSSHWKKSTVKKDGSIEHFGYATPIKSVLENLAIAYDENIIYNQASVGLVLPEDTKDEDLDLLPRSKDSILENDLNYSSWITQALGDVEIEETIANQVLEKTIKEFEAKSLKDSDDIYWPIASISKLSRILDKNIKIKEEISSKIIELYNKEEGSNFYIDNFTIQQGLTTTEECLKKVEKSHKKNSFYYIYLSSIYCSITELDNDTSVIEQTLNEWKSLQSNEEISKETYQSYLKNFGKILQSQFDLNAEVTKEQKEKIIEILGKTSNELTNLSESFKAESLRAFYKKDLYKIEKLEWSKSF